MYRSSAHVGHVRSVLGHWTLDDITPQSVLYQLRTLYYVYNAVAA